MNKLNYKVNFNRIEEECTIHPMHPTDSIHQFNNKFTGVYFNNEMNDELENILNIDESQFDHLTQILFMLKESFYNIYTKTVDWKSFTKDYVTDICKADEIIYVENWPNGLEYIDKFPKKINEFIENYCDIIEI